MPIIWEGDADLGGTLGLCAIWLNDALNPVDRTSIRAVADGYGLDQQIGGGVASDYGSGRSRSWTTPADTMHAQVTFWKVTPEQRRWLVEHRGRTVCFRDHLGTKFFGAYFAVPMTISTGPVDAEWAHNAATLSVTSVTFDESATA